MLVIRVLRSAAPGSAAGGGASLGDRVVIFIAGHGSDDCLGQGLHAGGVLLCWLLLVLFVIQQIYGWKVVWLPCELTANRKHSMTLVLCGPA